MFEYELIRQRQQQLQQDAEHARLVREARAAAAPAARSGLRARFARSVRRTDGAVAGAGTVRAARLGEC
ncbi:hypothetical protein AB0K43_12630 [Kitasatospora sp. NPDC049258]|uniref:hypothetical protein n=1 Tax=Kitasatospora sp. NPDC049258 TaxID=3155394 RepID=UPI00341E7836